MSVDLLFYLRTQIFKDIIMSVSADYRVKNRYNLLEGGLKEWFQQIIAGFA